MRYYEGIYCISARELIDGGIVTESNYLNWVKRKRVNVVKRGGGTKGSSALIAVDSLGQESRIKAEELYGGKRAHVIAWIKSNYEEDQEAMSFFNNPEKTGVRNLSIAKRREYLVNASVLNVCLKLYDNAKASQRLFGKSYDWTEMSGAINILQAEYGHTLPTTVLRFRKKANDYRKYGYISLVSGKFGNQSARLLTEKEEKVLLGLAVQPNQPWNKNVRDMYEMFVCGELDVWDPETGELYDPETYARTKDGEPWIPSETTINNFLNRPENQAFIKKRLMPYVDYYHEEMPHIHRHRGQYTLSQITMDDVDLPRRMKGNAYVHAYYAYDSVSECVLAATYSRGKDETLVDDCFRQLFLLIKKRQWGMPAGIEVENHLMTRHKDGLLHEGVIFSKVRFCAPQNSQEKQAESLNGSKKRSIIHKNREGIGRFYGKGKWRTYQKKISDSTNNLWEDKKYYTFEELVADDKADNAEWNNSLHPDQERYPGMTRWEVLISNINPNLRAYDEMNLARFLGERVETSIRRNSYCRVAGKDWWLSAPSILERLMPNNYKVTAYYLPTESGAAENVYLYQGETFIDKVERIETFNRVMAEQTEEDKAKFGKQVAKTRAFKEYIEDHLITRVGILENSTAKAAGPEQKAMEPEEISEHSEIAEHSEFAEDSEISAKAEEPELNMAEEEAIFWSSESDYQEKAREQL